MDPLSRSTAPELPKRHTRAHTVCEAHPCTRPRLRCPPARLALPHTAVVRRRAAFSFTRAFHAGAALVLFLASQELPAVPRGAGPLRGAVRAALPVRRLALLRRGRRARARGAAAGTTRIPRALGARADPRGRGGRPELRGLPAARGAQRAGERVRPHLLR
eukprot:1188427-Prymnesium_polylepis.2